MTGDGPMEFYWPDVGRLKIKSIGERSVILRYFPSEEAIARGLLAATGRLQKPKEGRECKRTGDGENGPSE